MNDNDRETLYQLIKFIGIEMLFRTWKLARADIAGEQSD